MLASFCRQTVTRIRPAAKDERGSEVFDWDNAESLDIANCSMQPAGTSLSEDGRVLGVMDGYTCYLPPTADVLAGDRIRFEGNTYMIKGEIRAWPSPTAHGTINHIIVNLVRYSG